TRRGHCLSSGRSLPATALSCTQARLARPAALAYHLPSLFPGNPDPSMATRLIIAEKPSVAADIARALGGFTRHDDYFESDKYLLSSAVGHLLEIGMPAEEEVKRGKW